MRRKAVEKLIDARIARHERPTFNRPASCDAMMATKSGVQWIVEWEVGFLRGELGELHEAIETVYRNGGDRRSDPNRADRNPK